MILILNVVGVNCEINIDNCVINFCVYGFCIDLVNDYKCYCEVQWIGKNCDIKLDFCNFNFCYNSAICLVFVDFIDFFCYCFQGFIGKFIYLFVIILWVSE